MSKMLICDYDGTVKTSSKFIQYLNFKAIKRFRENGNKLVFATGRTFSSIYKSLKYNNCEYDALICNDGSTIFNDKNELIYSNEIEKEQIEELIYYFRNNNKNLFDCVQLYDIDGYTTKLNNVIEIVGFPQLFGNIQEIIKELSDKYPDMWFYYSNFSILARKKCSKSSGIKEVNKIFNIHEENIYTVGDGLNDFEMIRDYNGYNVLFSHPKLYKVSSGTVLNVAHLVKKIENK